MEVVKLMELYSQTLDPNNGSQAEKQLNQIHKIIGFLPTTMQIVMEANVELPVRQAAAVFFKNEVVNYWYEKEGKNGQIEYSIHEQDKELIRNSIIEAIALSPPLIRNSLGMSLSSIIKNDFPGKWPAIVEKIALFLQSADPNKWYGGLAAFHYLAKNYEYKNNTERAPFLEAMKILHPLVYKLMVDLLPDNSKQAVMLEKMILKTIFVIVQYSLPLSLFTHEVFTNWMHIFRQVLDRPVPDEVNQLDTDEKQDLVWYKAKKWAIHSLVRIFERFGSPKEVQKEYRAFANWYVQTFSAGIIQVILKTLDLYAQNVYFPNRVIQQCINYLNNCVIFLETWKLIKPHISQLIERIIFPLMCYTDEDDELWSSDPQEYIRRKFDIFEDFISPVSASQTFLNNCCKKRKDMLKNTIAFSVQVLRSDTSSARLKDGALHMLGSVSDLLLRKKVYHEQINDMLCNYVLPFFQNEHPFLRARAAWVLHFFEDFDFDNDATLNQVLVSLQAALLNDKELPVRVQAAISLQVFVYSQEKTKPILEPNISTIIIAYLNVIKESQNDDVTNALQKIVIIFGEKVIPIAVQIIENLVNTLVEIITGNSDTTDSSIAIMGLLSAIDTVLMMTDSKELLEQLEPVSLKGVSLVLSHNLTEMHEECFNIVTSLTDRQISNDMWKLYEYIFQILVKQNNVEALSDMMSALHNYITVDPDAFLADPNRIAAFYEICKAVLMGDTIEDDDCNIIKLIEVLFLQYREKIESVIPSFCELVFARFMKGVNTEDLHSMCIMAFTVVFYFNTNLFFQIMDKLQQMFPNKHVLAYFFEEWLTNISSLYGLHDRKVCALGFSKLLTLEANRIPPSVQEKIVQSIPDLLKMFDNLKESYKMKAMADTESKDTDDEIDTDSEDEDGLEEDAAAAGDTGGKVTEMDDDDENDEFGNDDDDDDDDGDDDAELNELTSLESYETVLDKEDSNEDEYVIFRNAVEFVKNHNQNLYNELFGKLDKPKENTLKDIFMLAQLRQEAAESRKIEQGGGYVFSNQTVPASFNFGGSFS